MEEMGGREEIEGTGIKEIKERKYIRLNIYRDLTYNFKRSQNGIRVGGGNHIESETNYLTN